MLIFVLSATGTSAADLKVESEGKTPVATTVGVSARTSFVSQHADLIPLPEVESGVPVSMRVVNKRTTPEGTHYELEYLPFAAGEFDLRKALRTASGRAVEDGTPAAVRVGALLLDHDLDVTRRAPTIPVSPPWYRIGMITFALLWVAAGAVLLFRRPQQIKADPLPELSLHEKVRQALLSAARGNRSDLSSPELERLLLTYWQAELGLSRTKVDFALEQLRSHPDARAMLDQMNEWLHRPGAIEEVNTSELLGPLSREPVMTIEEAR